MRYIAITLLLTSSATAQVPPAKLADLKLERVTIDYSDQHDRAWLWTDAGMGLVQGHADWPLSEDYVLYRTVDETAWSVGYGFTTAATWESGNGPRWEFAYFVPDQPEPPPEVVLWEDATPHLSYAKRGEATLVCVAREDGTWEWSVRGGGQEAWQLAPTLGAAKQAAEEAGR